MREDVRERLLVISKEYHTPEKENALALLAGYPLRSKVALTRHRSKKPVEHIFYPDSIELENYGQFYYRICDTLYHTHIGYCTPVSPLELLALEAE